MKNNLGTLMREIFHNCIPKHYRHHIRLFWRILLGVRLITIGFLKGKRLNNGEAIGFSLNSQHVNPLVDSSNPLEIYFDSHTEGRGIWKFRHYFEIYHRHFSKFIGKKVRILEVGIYSGGSLGMWKNYFGPQCIVYGVDIEETCKIYEEESVKIYIGDQSDRNFWKRFKEEVTAIDIIVDDGGHKAYQQIVTLEEMFSHLSPGGVYLCEDVTGEFNPFSAYIYGLTRNLDSFNVGEEHSTYRANAFQQIVSSLHIYPFVVVIEKSENPISEFSAPKHGTQWQPFL